MIEALSIPREKVRSQCGLPYFMILDSFRLVAVGSSLCDYLQHSMIGFGCESKGLELHV